MACLHRAFGLVIESPVPLPGLPHLDEPVPPDITIALAPGAPYAGPPDGSAPIRPPHPVVQDRAFPLRAFRGPGMERYHLHYAEGCTFDIEGDASVRAAWSDDLTLQDAAVYLLGPVLGWIQRLRGRLCLHASSFVHEGAAVALMAPAGAGKSSLAALLAQRGYEVLSDDVTAIPPAPGPLSVYPACPRIGLWPPSIIRLFGDVEALPRITPTHPTWEKRFLALPEARFAEGRPVPLKAVYAAAPRPEAPGLTIEGTTRAGALGLLATNAYVAYLMDPGMRARDLDAMARLARAIPVRRVVARDRDDHPLEAIADRLLEDLAGIGSP